VSSHDSLAAMRRLAREHGLFVGPSSGAHHTAAVALAEREPGLRTIVTVFCDEGEKYLSEHFRAEEGQ
jgi:cysteine synthase A